MVRRQEQAAASNREKSRMSILPRRLRMSPQQAAALEAHLDRLVGELPEGRATDPLYSVLVGAYRTPARA